MGARTPAAARTLELLWQAGPSTRPGPRPGRSVDHVVAAATRLADRHGVGAVSMRGVAAELGVSVMGLYTYVPGKAELLDLMLDAAYLAMPRPPLADLPWRARVVAVAEANRVLCTAHPWVTALPATRPPLGPGLLAKYEHELSAFDGLGLADVVVDDALTHVLGFVAAVTRAAEQAREAEAASALTDAQWWDTVGPLLGRVVSPADHPRAVRIGTAAGERNGGAYDPDAAWDFGLARVLDGLAALLPPGDTG